MYKWVSSINHKDDWFKNQNLESIKVFDSQVKSLKNLGLNRETISIYVCGLTPYDSAHLGHAFTYSVFDVLVRFLKLSNKKVKYVQNITDVDDPLFERARRDSVNWQNIASSQIDKFIFDMESIGVNPPDIFTAVSDEMSAIKDANNRLLNLDALYQVSTDWYYKIPHVEHPLIKDFALEDLLTIFSERGGDPYRDGKKNPLDPIVWKQSLPDEPAWESELGSGRPGWHIECVAIIEKYLELPLLIQGGGKDLIFPHHTMCSWQIQSLSKNELAQSYLHAGLVSYQGEKMSKSLGNLVFVSDLIEKGFSQAAIRIQLLDKPWHEDWEWFESDLIQSQVRAEKWKKFVSKVRVDAELVEFVFLNLKNNLDIATIFNKIDTLHEKIDEEVEIGDSLQALLSDCLGIRF